MKTISRLKLSTKNRTITQLRGTVAVLIADAARYRGERDEARRLLVIADTRVRDAHNRLDGLAAFSPITADLAVDIDPANLIRPVVTDVAPEPAPED